MTNINKEQEKLSILNILIIVLSIYVLVALLIDTFFKLPTQVSNVLEIIDNGICIIFLIDFCIRFYKAKSKLQFIKWGWIDLISSIPALEIFRVGRLFRLIRLLRILRAFRSTKILIHHIFKSRMQGTMTSVVVITILIIIFSSISILIVEKAPESNIKTAEDAIWWAMVTVTTVGYGDKFPVTTEGRVIAIFLMTAGVGLFGTYTGYIATWFIEEKKKEEIEEIEEYKNNIDE